VYELRKVLLALSNKERLAAKYRDHKLTGKLAGWRECHVKPDLLLLYSIDTDNGLLILGDLGSHTELFG